MFAGLAWVLLGTGRKSDWKVETGGENAETDLYNQAQKGVQDNKKLHNHLRMAVRSEDLT